MLASYSSALLPLTEWRAMPDGNVDVQNETADYYRYFDATRHAEFLYACVEQTVDHDLPEEVRFLEAFDKFSIGVKHMVEMPDREIERLRGFLAQGHGRLSQRAREREFRTLTDEEAARIEALYDELFGAPGSRAPDHRSPDIIADSRPPGGSRGASSLRAVAARAVPSPVMRRIHSDD